MIDHISSCHLLTVFIIIIFNIKTVIVKNSISNWKNDSWLFFVLGKENVIKNTMISFTLAFILATRVWNEEFIAYFSDDFLCIINGKFTDQGWQGYSSRTRAAALRCYGSSSFRGRPRHLLDTSHVVLIFSIF